MEKRPDAAVGVAVAALVVLLIALAKGISLLALIAGAVLLGASVTAARQQQGNRGDERGKDRPWRDR